MRETANLAEKLEGPPYTGQAFRTFVPLIQFRSGADHADNIGHHRHVVTPLPYNLPLLYYKTQP